MHLETRIDRADASQGLDQFSLERTEPVVLAIKLKRELVPAGQGAGPRHVVVAVGQPLMRIPTIAATPSERSDAGLGWSVGLGVFGLLWSLQFSHGIACQCQPVGMVHEAI